MAAVNLSVTFPRRGVIRLQSRSLFGDVESPTCRRFLGRVLQATEITSVTIHGGRSPRAELRFCPGHYRRDEVVERIIALLRNGADGTTSPRDRHGVARYYRYGALVTGWKITLDQPGRLRLKNPVLYRRSGLCQAIERELRRHPGDRPVPDQLVHRHRAGRLRPHAARPIAGDRDPGCRARRRRASPSPRQAGPAPAGLHGVAADRRRGPVRRAGAPASGRDPLRLHVDSHLPRSRQRPLQGEAPRRARARRGRRHRLSRDDVDLPGGGALLVSRRRPRAGQADAGQLQENAARRLRQAAAIRLAVPRWRRGPRAPRPDSGRGTSSSSRPATSSRSTATSSRAWR